MDRAMGLLSEVGRLERRIFARGIQRRLDHVRGRATVEREDWAPSESAARVSSRRRIGVIAEPSVMAGEHISSVVEVAACGRNRQMHASHGNAAEAGPRRAPVVDDAGSRAQSWEANAQSAAAHLQRVQGRGPAVRSRAQFGVAAAELREWINKDGRWGGPRCHGAVYRSLLHPLQLPYLRADAYGAGAPPRPARRPILAAAIDVAHRFHDWWPRRRGQFHIDRQVEDEEDLRDSTDGDVEFGADGRDPFLPPVPGLPERNGFRGACGSERGPRVGLDTAGCPD